MKRLEGGRKDYSYVLLGLSFLQGYKQFTSTHVKMGRTDQLLNRGCAYGRTELLLVSVQGFESP